MKTDQSGAVSAGPTPDDAALLGELVYEESKDDIITEDERAKFGSLHQLYPTQLLKHYWESHKLDKLFPWQIECLSKRTVLN